MSKKTLRHHSPEDKVRILRLHLIEHQPISEICEAEGIHPLITHDNQYGYTIVGSWGIVVG